MVGEKMTLFEECVVALGDSTVILSAEETKKVFNSMISDFPITSWGRIDWEKVDNAIQVSSISEVLQYIGLSENEVYILWDEASLPSVRTEISKVLSVIDDITAVSFDTWIYCRSDRYIVEFYHEGEINIGWIIN